MILPEHQILKLLLDKAAYLKYNKYIYNIYNKDINIYLYNIYKALEVLHAKTEADVTLEALHVATIAAVAPPTPEARADYDSIFKAIAESNVPPEQVQDLVEALIRKSRLQLLALKAYEASTSGQDRLYKEVLQLSGEISSPEPIATEDTEKWFVTDDLETLYQRQVQQPGLRWRLNTLNHSLGSLRKGNFGVLFARPETGKTTFLASEATFMSAQAKGPVLWFNNEQVGEEVKYRIYQAALGIPMETLNSNRPKWMKEYFKVTGGRIKLHDDAGFNKQFVEQACAVMKPSLVIFDQIDKIRGFQDDRDDLKLGAIYQWARELAKEYAPVIGVCQADGTAEGVKWLNMGHMANAKTAKQAECDWILGIGMSHEPGFEMVRHLSICKNKLFGDADSIPEMRHGRMDVIIKPIIARYEDII